MISKILLMAARPSWSLRLSRSSSHRVIEHKTQDEGGEVPRGDDAVDDEVPPDHDRGSREAPMTWITESVGR